MLSLRANAKYPGDWKERHNAAVALHADGKQPRFIGSADDHRVLAEDSIARLLQAWARYADAHKGMYGSPIGEDGVLGDEWRTIGLALRGLLNGELGRLDGGTLDAFILDTLRAEGAD